MRTGAMEMSTVRLGLECLGKRQSPFVANFLCQMLKKSYFRCSENSSFFNLAAGEATSCEQKHMS